tara:strand:+ start:20 stop:547 length:528 start_codon:yes stop_codon:yes gene_type:complete
MELLKDIDDLTKLDKKHELLSRVNGYLPNIEKMHKVISQEKLNAEVPNDIQGQFNVARNMALYTYYLYALAPEVQLKTYTIIEHALRVKANSKKRLMLRNLLELAIKNEWIKDKGFRHLKSTDDSMEWCNSLIKVIPSLRNSQAHGSTLLEPSCFHHIFVCADFLNQLFPNHKCT